MTAVRKGEKGKDQSNRVVAEKDDGLRAVDFLI